MHEPVGDATLTFDPTEIRKLVQRLLRDQKKTSKAPSKRTGDVETARSLSAGDE